MGRHDVGGAGETEHVSNGKQDLSHDLRIIRVPLKTGYVTNDRTFKYLGKESLLDRKVTNTNTVSYS